MAQTLTNTSTKVGTSIVLEKIRGDVLNINDTTTHSTRTTHKDHILNFYYCIILRIRFSLPLIFLN